MRTLILKSLSLLAVLSLTSCSGDDDPTIDNFINTPNMSGKPVKSITRSGFVKEAYDWTFEYNSNGKMTEAQSVYKDASGTETVGKQYTISYSTSNVTVETTSDKLMQFSINDAYLLSTVKSGDVEYRYRYDMDGRLIGWTQVTYDDDGFHESSRNSAEAKLVWDNLNLISVTYTPLTKVPDDYIIYEFEYTDKWNDNGILPEIDTKALGCKGFEFMYYAGMLGKSTKNLVDRVSVVYSKDSTKNMTYKFGGYRYQEQNNSRNLASFNFEPENSANSEITIVTFGY